MQQAESTWDPSSDFNKSMLKTILSSLENNKLHPLLLWGQRITVINSIWFWYAKTKFQFDSPEKKKAMMRLMNYYAEEFPCTEYLMASNVFPLMHFFMSPLNLLPQKTYASLHANTDNSIRQIIADIASYSSKFSKITISN